MHNNNSKECEYNRLKRAACYRMSHGSGLELSELIRLPKQTDREESRNIPGQKCLVCSSFTFFK